MSLADLAQEDGAASADTAEPEDVAAELESPQETEERAEPTEEAVGEQAGDGEEAGEDTDQPSEDSGPDALRQFEELIRTYGGADISGKYQSLGEALAGVAQATALVGRRDEAATRYEQLRQRIGDEQLRALEAAAPRQPDGLPPVEEFQRLQARAAKGDQAATGRIDEINEQYLLRTYEISRHWPQLQEVLRLAQQGDLLTRREAAQTNAQREGQQWVRNHQAELYLNGNYDPAQPAANLSALGRETARLMSEGIRDPGKALEIARKTMPKPATPRKSPKRARHGAPIAPSPAGGNATPDEVADAVMQRDGDLDNFFIEMARRSTVA